MLVEKRFPWVAVSAVVALLLLGIAAMVPTVVEGPSVAKDGKLPKLGLARINEGGATELLTERIMAYDPAPLFVPSAMNSSEAELPLGIRPGSEGPFDELAARFTRSVPLSFPARVKAPHTAIEGLRRTEGHDAHLAFDRMDEVAPSTGSAVVRIEVLKLGEGSLVQGFEITAAPMPGSDDWQPLEMVGAITREGLVGDLVITASSGSSEIDDNFRSLLGESVLTEQRLSVGFYTFRVGR
jgi:hypothetical protein